MKNFQSFVKNFPAGMSKEHSKISKLLLSKNFLVTFSIYEQSLLTSAKIVAGVDNLIFYMSMRPFWGEMIFLAKSKNALVLHIEGNNAAFQRNISGKFVKIAFHLTRQTLGDNMVNRKFVTIPRVRLLSASFSLIAESLSSRLSKQRSMCPKEHIQKKKQIR